MGLGKFAKSLGSKAKGVAKSVGGSFQGGAKKFGVGAKKFGKQFGQAAQGFARSTPLGGLLPGGGSSGGGDLGSRAKAARGLVRRSRQAGAGSLSTMNEEDIT